MRTLPGMKKVFFILILAGAGTLFAQPDTEVFTMDVATSSKALVVSNVQNISNNPGYDNQPSFVDFTNLLYAGTKNGATDIVGYHIPSGRQYWLNIPTEGGEYSPQNIPGGKNMAAVRLDPDGKQRLYKYHFPEGNSEELIEDIQVAYYAFYDENTILASVLSDGALDLVKIDLLQKKTDTILQGVGRSIHKVPNQNSMSYTAVNEEGNHDIYLMDMNDGQSYFVCQLPIGVQDYAWLDDSRLILGSNSALFIYETFTDGGWTKAADLKDFDIKDITRVAVSPNSKRLALAAISTKGSPADIVEAHIAPFNNGELEAFVNCFSEDVVVSNYPNKVMYTGRDKMREGYRQFYEEVSEYGVAVKNRIVFGNTVIDEEVGNVSGKADHKATIYQVAEGKIASMSFVWGQPADKNAEAIIQKQLDAYNAKDIDAFMATYADDVQLFNYPDSKWADGKSAMRETYARLFENTPDLKASIKNRIVVGGAVIDEEEVTINGRSVTAIAIYKVENGLIKEVRFIQ